MAAPYAAHNIVGSYSVFARWHHLHRSVSLLVVKAIVHGIVCMHVKNEYIFYTLLHEKWGAVAEWVERRSLNPEVLGSIPPTPFRILGKFVYPTLP